MAIIPQILSALIAIPKIADLVMAAVSQVVLWYVGRQQAETLSMISDAAALAARASTDDERYAAALAWKNALSRPRITP